MNEDTNILTGPGIEKIRADAKEFATTTFRQERAEYRKGFWAGVTFGVMTVFIIAAGAAALWVR